MIKAFVNGADWCSLLVVTIPRNRSFIFFYFSLLFSTAELILPPQNVTVIVTSFTSVNVTWIPLKCFDSTQCPTMYKVQWTAGWFDWKVFRTSAIVKGTSYSIQGLWLLLTYEIQVATMNWGQTGPYSEPVTVKKFDRSSRKYKCIDILHRTARYLSAGPIFIGIIRRSLALNP